MTFAAGRPPTRSEGRTRPMAVRFVAAAACGAIASVIIASAASAHPTDEMLQQVYVTPTATGVSLDVELTPGVLVAPEVMALIDRNGNGQIDDAEAAAHAEVLRAATSVGFDGASAPVRLVGLTYPDAALLAAGGGTIKLSLVADAPEAVPASGHTVTVTEAYAPVRTVTQASVVLDGARTVQVDQVTHADDGRTTTVAYRAAIAAATTASSSSSTPAPTTAAAASSGPFLLSALRRPLDSAGALVVLLTASALLGAFHALTPGHGKTLLAAYLVGERGTPRQAVALGGAVTVTHTASVIGIGIAVLAAGRYVVPGVLVPSLEVGAGLLVVLLGLRLVLHRWRERRPDSAAARAHGHEHDHEHHQHADDHDHSHDAGHDHGHHHRHVPDGNRPLGFRSLVAMGVSGGIVPCPEALGVLLLAVAVHRTLLGIGMIVAFSAGLAAVLVGLGLVLVSARSVPWFQRPRLRNPRLTTLLPLCSAMVVTVLGIAMALRGLGSLASR